MEENKKKYRIIKYFILLVLIPVVIIAGNNMFGGKKYAFLSLVIVILSCIPFFISFERKKNNIEQMVILAVLVALSVFGRYCFAAIPHFKPVTAMVIITGIYMGGEMGFLCGALSAVISNFIFGQGPWTPFQMFAWGVLGLFAGILSKQLKKNLIWTIVYGIICGAVYSLIMDIWTTLWQDGVFNIRRYIGYLITGTPTTVIYMVSNAIFLLILARPIGKKIDRVKTKFGI